MANNPSHPEKECQLALDATLIDTTPGAHRLSPFSPPSGWEGDAAAYLDLMRQRFKCVDFSQRLGFVAGFARRYPVQYQGPFADEARRVIEGINQSRLGPEPGALLSLG